MSYFQDLPDHAIKSFHKRPRIIESMPRVHSYVIILDLECDALVLVIFHHLLAYTKDDHSPMSFANIRSILLGILGEMDDLLLEFLISILSRCQAMSSPSAIAQIMSNRVSETCISQIPGQPE